MNRLIALSACVCASLAIACSDQNSSPNQPSAATAARGTASLTVQSGGRFTNLPVTTTISDTDASGLPADIASDDFNGAGSASYTNSATLTSWLLQDSFNSLPYGDWQFDTYNSMTRSVRHDFLNPVVAPPFPLTDLEPPAGPYPTHLQVTCTFQHQSMIALSPASNPIHCGLNTNFEVSTTLSYVEQMSPEYTGLSGTTDVQITCNATNPNVSPAGCTDWSIDPLPGTGSVAQLLQHVASKGNKVTATEVGNFNVRFHFHITRP